MDHRPLSDREIVERCCLSLTQTYLEIAKGAKRGLETLEKEKKIVLRQVNGVEMWVALSDKGEPSGLTWVALEYKNTIGKVRVRPSGEGSTIYVASLPYLLTRYATIVGLSGSLGGESEKKYLEK